jgi:serine/threonine protein kinase
MVGQQLDEYRLEALLGQGGMACVYRAFDVRLKRWAAVKVINTPFRTDPSYRSRFEREAQAIARLKHPHIVSLYRYGEAQGLLYLAMEYIEGEDLERRLAGYQASQSPFPVVEAGRIIRQVCLALDYAHSQGVIHRDVKPSNIMLDRQGQAILTDFGLVLLDSYQTQGQVLGTPHYVAPEQAISSAKAVPQSDLYAVGIILYEMFTGKLPFQATHPHDLALLHLSEPPPPPHSLKPDFNPELEAVILKTLAKEPEERYPSGAALAEALEQALQITAAPVTPSLPVEPYQPDSPGARPRPRSQSSAFRLQQEQNLINAPFGKYHLLVRLGQGGMATVYKAYDSGLARYVAIKIMHPHLTDNEDFIERFQSEAIVVAGLRHPNIVQVHNADVEQDKYYIVMEFIDGPSLEAKLIEQRLKNQYFSLVEILDIFKALASAVDYAHAKGIVHRDLKPSNIMFTVEGQAVLTDFGIARLTDVVGYTMTGAVIGTPAYMSPEQAQGQRGDQRSDIYSLGVILYQMVTGRVPYEAETPLGVMMQLGSHRSFLLPTALNPTLPKAVEQVILKALATNPEERYQSAGELIKALQAAVMTQDAAVLRLMICYDPRYQPDRAVAQAIFQSLSPTYQILVDPGEATATRLATEMEGALNQADFLICLVSAESVHSPLIRQSLEKAYRLTVSQHRGPTMLPVRLAYRQPFPYPLNLYLDSLNWSFWRNSKDMPRIVAELKGAIAGGNLPIDERLKPHLLQPEPASASLSNQPVPLELPEGTMEPYSPFYIMRPGDQVALEEIGREGVTLTIKGPRQVGKSSMLMRLAEAATRHGKRVVILDFQLFDQAAFKDAETFFRQFCAWFSDELGLADQVATYWQNPLGNSQRCTRYIGRYLLKEMGQPLLLAMDEVDTIFETDFRDDFFGMLRSWHNSRARPNQHIWKWLDLALVTSTEPYQFITNLNQSPFNVGLTIELSDFDLEQMAELNRRHDSPLAADQLHQLAVLVGGHPYLARRALYLVASRQLSPTELFSRATDERGPFIAHLHYHLARLQHQPALKEGLKQVIRSQTLTDELVFFRLQGAGLIRRENERVLPRCPLYAVYFQERLDG